MLIGVENFLEFSGKILLKGILLQIFRKTSLLFKTSFNLNMEIMRTKTENCVLIEMLVFFYLSGVSLSSLPGHERKVRRIHLWGAMSVLLHLWCCLSLKEILRYKFLRYYSL